MAVEALPRVRSHRRLNLLDPTATSPVVLSRPGSIGELSMPTWRTDAALRARRQAGLRCEEAKWG